MTSLLDLIRVIRVLSHEVFETKPAHKGANRILRHYTFSLGVDLSDKTSAFGFP